MKKATKLRRMLGECPPGKEGWKQFEDLCIETLTFLFVPPLKPPIIQPRSCSGIDRRDAAFPNRKSRGNNIWRQLLDELNARMILFEFKNFDKEEVGKDATNQIRNYLTTPIGKLGIICSNKPPNKAALIKRNSIYSEDGKVILFITTEHLKEMMLIKERGDDPSDLIMDLVERFYMQYE